MPLIARLVLGLVGDAVFDATAGRLRDYEAEFDRYLEARGFRRTDAPSPRRTS
jgi:hypothetical protein